ncbi:hypothetical protein PSPO01_15854 [Paraphaeosphaeria sporulosa]
MILGNIDAGDDTPSLRRTIGNVTYHIVPRRDEPRPIKFILKKRVATAFAERLAELGPVNTLFTLEVFENASIISSFADAASLGEILNILAAVSSLRGVGLQRNGFSVSDILLVGRNDTYFFQITGIKNCTCISDHEPTNSEELDSLVRALNYVA